MREFNVGDACQIRQWEDMMDEFGGSEYAVYTPGVVFIDDMRYLCGQKFTIAAISRGICSSVEGVERVPGWFIITTDMLEAVNPEPIEGITLEDLMSILGG